MKWCYIVLISFLFCTKLFALTPFSLEGLKEVNVALVDKGKLLNLEQKKALEKEIEQKLHRLNIQTSSKHFSNFLVKAERIKSSHSSLYHVSISLSETTTLDRSKKPLEAIALTYIKEDMFESQNPFEDIKESLLFLLEEFTEQYMEENQK